jgi:hypothetical protein
VRSAASVGLDRSLGPSRRPLRGPGALPVQHLAVPRANGSGGPGRVGRFEPKLSPLAPSRSGPFPVRRRSLDPLRFPIRPAVRPRLRCLRAGPPAGPRPFPSPHGEVSYRVRPPGPPRCRPGLQRLTAGRSRSLGFPAPPSPLSLSAWVLASSGPRPLARFPAPVFAAPGLGLTLEVLSSASPASPRLASHVRALRFRAFLPWGSPPLRRSQLHQSTRPSRSSRSGSPITRSASPFPPERSRGFRLPAPFRLRRFSRPWRLAPAAARGIVSSPHAHGVHLPASPSFGPAGSGLRLLLPGRHGVVLPRPCGLVITSPCGGWVSRLVGSRSAVSSSRFRAWSARPPCRRLAPSVRVRLPAAFLSRAPPPDGSRRRPCRGLAGSFRSAHHRLPDAVRCAPAVRPSEPGPVTRSRSSQPHALARFPLRLLPLSGVGRRARFPVPAGRSHRGRALSGPPALPVRPTSRLAVRSRLPAFSTLARVRLSLPVPLGSPRRASRSVPGGSVRGRWGSCRLRGLVAPCQRAASRIHLSLARRNGPFPNRPDEVNTPGGALRPPC